MRLSLIKLENFRLLRSIEVRVGDAASSTILVGPNNSGKTSLVEALQLFIRGSIKDFSLSDFSICCSDDFSKAQAAFLSPPPEPSAGNPAVPTLPAIRLTLQFDYEDVGEDLAVAADLMMDLDEGAPSVAVCIELRVTDIDKLAAEFVAERAPDESLHNFLASRLPTYYSLAYFKVAPGGAEREPLKDGAIIQRLLRVDFVGAQRHIDDQDTSSATRLSRLLHQHYNRRYETDDPDGHEELEKILKTQSTELSDRYTKAFKGLLDSLLTFGYPQRQAPRLTIRADLDSSRLFKDTTQVFYSTDLPKTPGSDVTPTHELPEKYNGLGIKNLIYMVLQIRSFREDYLSSDQVRPRVQLIMVEEPEVHLHPQPQSVFIKQVSAFLKSVGPDNPAQLLLTTHSSHIVADCGFAPVRYFRRIGTEATVRDLLEFQTATKPAQPEALRFLARYLTQTRCDLLFADKAVLVEGPVERLLLPRMIAEVAQGPLLALATDYIAVLEVGGAYAHLFRPLLEFIALPTLIITDLDSTGPDRKKCAVADGTASSNATLTQWLPGKSTFKELCKASEAERTAGPIRVTFQLPAGKGELCGRTFEEAFIYENADWLVANSSSMLASAGALKHGSPKKLKQDAYRLVASDDLKKVDFALDLIITDGWKTPLYIANGLKWLAEQGI